MKWYHGSDKRLTVLRCGSWITNKKSIAKTFGKFVHSVDVSDTDIDFDIIYSVVENTNEYRGTLKKDSVVNSVARVAI